MTSNWETFDDSLWKNVIGSLIQTMSEKQNTFVRYESELTTSLVNRNQAKEKRAYPRLGRGHHTQASMDTGHTTPEKYIMWAYLGIIIKPRKWIDHSPHLGIHHCFEVLVSISPCFSSWQWSHVLRTFHNKQATSEFSWCWWRLIVPLCRWVASQWTYLCIIISGQT